ncbi:MAG TPA: tetratricopeptide repeat protein, partial [Chitinophagaceae bacterium]|nr:tetratricopeptide repeat protein [Chitinophagaceae bacterium]
MRPRMPLSRHILLFVLLSGTFSAAKAQLGFELDIKKPAPYENRELRAEKTGNKKFTKPRRFWQNTTTHYNYFFNAQTKLNEIIARAKSQHRDDYGELLPFYNYSLEATSAEKEQLDSVIYKSKTGIVMHDLRSDWIDDLYLLWGAAYFLQQQHDSAFQIFQFINTSFADKDKDGYYRYIGSRLDGATSGSIATKEERSRLQELVSDPPSRNNALVWLVRTFIEQGRYTEAGTLVETLKRDPNFPERLFPALEEVQALLFYRQERWDSAAIHLEAALPQAGTKGERARWEYLAAQLYERSKNGARADSLFHRAIAHTTDPVLDIYARLNLIRLNKEGGDDYINRNINELLTMARRDRYADYRDRIYFMIAQMELERKDPKAAQEYLLRGLKYSTEDPASKNRLFLQLADLSYSNGDFLLATGFYDSLNQGNLKQDELVRVEERKSVLQKLVPHFLTIQRQDSLQKIAAMPEAERTAYVKKLLRQLRRQQGLKEEENGPAPRPAAAERAADLFDSRQKGEWYFYNKNALAQGAATFRQVWGNRPNQDNWRRQSDVTASAGKGRNGIPAAGEQSAAAATAELSVDGLMAGLPLNEAALTVSNDSIQGALYASGQLLQNELQDYAAAIGQYEELRARYPYFNPADELLFNLYYCYYKLGNTAKAAEIKKLLADGFPGSRLTAIATTGKDPVQDTVAAGATRAYEEVYSLFLEG